MQTKIGFIGSGNMAECIAVGLINNNWNTNQIMVLSPQAANKDWIQQQQIPVANSIDQLADSCDILLLATKPQQAQQALETISLGAKQCLISVAAGISIEFLNQVLNSDQPNHIIRAMPNTPSMIGSGITGLYAATATKSQFGDIADSIFNAVGNTVWVNDEPLMDVVTAISGSGPAYYFLFVEAMISAAIELGLDNAAATSLAINTLSGAAALLKSTDSDPTLLRQNVTSPGGTTAAAIASFETDNIKQIIANAVIAANQRGKSLNKNCLESLENNQ